MLGKKQLLNSACNPVAGKKIPNMEAYNQILARGIIAHVIYKISG